MRPIFHIALALLIQVSVIGITVSRHYCGEVLQQIAIMDTGKSCCDAEQDMPLDCCNDEIVVVGSDDSFSFNTVYFHLKVAVDRSFQQGFEHARLNPQNSAKIAFSPFYRPPRLIPDIPIVIQSFLL